MKKQYAFSLDGKPMVESVEKSIYFPGSIYIHILLGGYRVALLCFTEL